MLFVGDLEETFWVKEAENVRCLIGSDLISPILANWPELAVLTSTVLPRPICLDFMQCIFGIPEAY